MQGAGLETERAIGGRHLLDGTVSNTLTSSSAVVTGSAPSSAGTAWEVHVRGSGGVGSAGNGTVVTYAICAPG